MTKLILLLACFAIFIGMGYAACMIWVPTSISSTPRNAFRGGTDADGSAIYVGRSTFQRNLLPTKVVPDRRFAYTSYDGRERRVYSVEVLIADGLKWVSAGNGRIPCDGVVGGITVSGEKQYIGRANYRGSLQMGRIHPPDGCLYIAYSNKENCVRSYDVLCKE